MYKSVIIFLAVLFLTVFTSNAFAKIEMMLVSELKPGMKGIGKTVIEGTKVEEFDVEIIGILKKGGFNGGPMILVRCTGDVIEKTGGVAGGYSGSPIYIDGKLVGALAAAWHFADHEVAGVSPINEMIKNFYFEDNPSGAVKISKLDSPISLYDRDIDTVSLSLSIDESKILQNELGDNAMVLTACKTPLFVSGLSPEVIDIIKEELGPHMPFLEIMSGSGSGMTSGGFGMLPNQENPSDLEAGSAIGMQLVTGDIDFTAVGTLTYYDPDDPEKRFLAFGHPFLQRGHINAPITSARIVFTVPALDRSFKMGEPIEIIGKASQDRSVAVSGFIGQMPELVNVNLEIRDLDQNNLKTFKLGIIPEEDFLPLLTLLPLMQGMSQVVDRSGQATAKIEFTVKGEGLAESILRENLYFSTSGPSVILSEPLELLSMLTSGNIYREVMVSEIDVKVELTKNRQTLDIVEIEFDDTPVRVENATKKSEHSEHLDNDSEIKTLLDVLQEIPEEPEQEIRIPISAVPSIPASVEIKSFFPGDTIRIKALLKPYRQEVYEKYFEIEIPEDINPGMTQVEVKGGGGFSSRFMQGPAMVIPMGFSTQPAQLGLKQEKPPKTLDEVLDRFIERDHNNELIVELQRPAENDPKKAKQLMQSDERPEPIRVVQPTDKVIYGSFQLPLEIKKPEDAKKDEEDEPEIVEETVSEEPEEEDKKPDYRQNWKESIRNKYQ